MVANRIEKTNTGVSLERRSAPVAQWTVYLALSTSMGFVWAGLYLLIASTFSYASIQALSVVEDTLPWFLAASFCAGLTFRLFALRKGRSPSIWYATVIPAFGALAFVLMSVTRQPFSYSELAMVIVAAFGVTYVCGGIFIIPLAIVQTKALQWLHVKLTEWTSHASIRAIRQVGYATICGCLLLATEAPRYLDKKAHEHAEAVGWLYGVKMPKTAYVLSSRDNVDPETYVLQQDAHFRVPGGMPWPPTEKTINLSQGENAREVRARFLDIAGQKVSAEAELEQVKWYEPSGWIEASRLRTPEADFVEFRRR